MLYNYNGYLYAVVNNILYQINPTTGTNTVVGSLSDGIVNVSATHTLNNNYLFLHNSTYGYTLNSSGGYIQIQNDGVVTTSILTGGSNYVNPTVTFAAPSAGVTATGTVQYTGGVITGVTITARGSGYSTIPTITFTDTNLTFSCVNTSGTPTLTTSTVLDAGLVGATITGTGIPTSTTITAISGLLVTLSANTTSGVTSATVTARGAGATASCLLNQFPTGPFVPGAVFLDSTMYLATKAGRIYGSYLGDPTAWDALNFISAESEPDNLVGIAKHLNYILGFGEWSTDFFYDAGNAVGSPLSVAQSYKSEIGCANGDSIVQFEQTVAWIGKSKATGTAVYMMDGVSPIKISTPYIERMLGNSTLADIKAYAFKFNGHMFYVLTLHDLNMTVVFDVNEKQWYQWTMWATDSSGNYGEQYFRPSFYAGFGTGYYLLDDDNGILYTLSDTQYTDSGAPIYYRCVTDIIDSGTTKRKFYGRVEIIGDKIPATMMIRHTSDDYKTWSSYRAVDLSKTRSQINQTGASRRRAWEFLCTDPVALRLDAAEVDFEIGELEQDQAAPTQYRG
jgi:hypothetical protein